MSAGDIALNILINASSGNTMGIIGQVEHALTGLAGGAGPLGAIVGVGAAATAALVTVGVEAVKVAGNFQQMTNTLVTSAGESAANLDSVRKGILDISTSTGTSTHQLVDAMYQIESSGKHGADGLNVLKVAAQGAKAENADLGTVAKALTTVLTDYHMSSGQAADAMNGLVATVQNGKTNLQQLAGAMGAVLPIASALHVKFPDVAGAIATMTNAGMPAQQAAQNLAHVLVALSAPSGIAVKSMKAVGLSAQQVKDALANQGLPAALKLIEDHVGKQFPKGSVAYETAMKNILGGLVGFKMSAMLTGQSLKDFEGNIKKISTAMADGKGEVLGWDVVQSSFNFKVDQAKMAVEALMITLGTKLLPIITPIVGGIADFISHITTLISGMDGASGSTKSLSGVFGLLSVSGGYLKDIFKLIGQAIGMVFGHDFQQASTTVGDFAKDAIGGLNSVLFTIDELLDPIVNKVLPAFLKLRDAVSGDLMTAFKAFGGIIGGDLQKNFGSLDQAASHLVPGIEGIADGMSKAADYIGQLKPVFEEIGTYLGQTFSPVIDELTSEFNDRIKPAWDQFVASIGPAMPALKFLAEVFGVILVVSLKYFAQAAADSIKLGIDALGLLIMGVLNVAQSFMDLLADASKAWDNIVAVWNAAPGFFTGIWNTIKKAFGDAWKWVSDQAAGAWKWVTNAWGAAGKWFQLIGSAIQKAIGDAWTWIQNSAKQAWAAIVKAVTKPIDDIINSFKWLYDHNYYFHDLVEAIKKAFHDGIQWIEDTWNAAVTWLTKLWQQLSQTASDLWNKIAQVIQQKIGEAGKFIQDQWGRLTGWLSQQWNSLAKAAQQAWDSVAKVFNDVWNSISNALSSLWKNISQWWTTTQTQSQKSADATWKSVSTTFSNAWNTYISKPLGTLWTNISQWFTKTGNDFKTWGGNMLKMLGDGVTSGFHYVTTAITNLGNEIVKLLSFHSPPAAGPLHTSDQWFPTMMKMFASGITANIKAVTDAITNIANEIKKILGIPTSAPTGGAQTGPLQSAGTWMSNLTTKFANGITAGIPKVTTATTKLATTISTQFANLNTTVNTSTNNVNNQLMLLSSNVGTQTNKVSSQFMTLTNNVNTSTANINTAVANVNTNVSNNMGKAVSSINQASSQAQSGAQQVGAAGQQAVGSADFANSGVQTHFGNATKYATQTVQGVSAAGQQMDQLADQAKEHSTKATQAILENIKSTIMMDAKGQLTSFMQFVSEFAQTVQAEISYAAMGISSLLAHSTPKEGPLRNDDVWGKHFMENIIGGMQSQMPALSAVTNQVTGVLSGVSVPAGTSASSSIRTASPSNNQPMIIYNVLDGKKISKVVTNWQSRELRVQGVVRGQ
jgi:TP901 family phage tail tape measure protein